MLYLLIERVFDYNYFIKCFSEWKIKILQIEDPLSQFDTLLVLTHYWFWHTCGFDTLLVLTHFLFWHTFGFDTLFVCLWERKTFQKLFCFCWLLAPSKDLFDFFNFTFLNNWIFLDYWETNLFFWNFWGYFSVNFWSL